MLSSPRAVLHHSLLHLILLLLLFLSLDNTFLKEHVGDGSESLRLLRDDGCPDH